MVRIGRGHVTAVIDHANGEGTPSLRTAALQVFLHEGAGSFEGLRPCRRPLEPHKIIELYYPKEL